MTCTRCGATLRTGARFCGACGEPVAEGHPPVGDGLMEAIAATEALGETLADEPWGSVLGMLGRSGRGTSLRVVVVGDRQRGKSTVVGRLGELGAVVGAPVVVDELPDLNALEPGALILADVVLVVLTVTQLLSRVEREAILERVLPMVTGAVALVVTRMDALETDEDVADMERRLVAFVAVAGRPLGVFRLGPGGAPWAGDLPGVGEPAVPLAAWVGDALATAARTPAAHWVEKVAFVLGRIDQDEAEGDRVDRADTQAATFGTSKLGAHATRTEALRTEVDLALAEAQAVLRNRMAGLRTSLPVTLLALPSVRLAREAPTVVRAAVRAVADEVAALWLTTLERELLARSDDATRAAASGFAADHSASAAGQLDPASEAAAAGAASAAALGGRPPRTPEAMLLSGVGVVTVAVVGGPAGWLGGGVLLTGAWWAREQARRRFTAQLGDDVRMAVCGWLDEAESALSAGLTSLAANGLVALDARVVRAEAEEESVAGRRGGAVARCRLAVSRIRGADQPADPADPSTADL